MTCRLLAVLAFITNSLPGGDPSIQAWIRSTGYCTQKNGLDVFSVEIATTYKNNGDRKLIIPRFATHAATSLYQREIEKEIRVERIVDGDLLSETVWRTPLPDAEWFTVVDPGQSMRGRILTDYFVISGQTNPSGSVRSGEYSIRFLLNHGDGLRGSVPQAWLDIGDVVQKMLSTSAVYIQIPSGRPSAKCSGPPFITVR